MPAMEERSQTTERRTKSPHPNSLANLRPVQPGQPSLSPGGRPKVPAEVREAAMALTRDAIRVLGEIMNDPKAPPATRVTAADKILDRALGRPAQSVEVKGEKRDLLEYSIADLVAIAYQRGMEGGSIEGEVVDASTAETSSAPSDAEPREYLIA